MGNEQHQNPKSDIEIARAASLRNITEISDKLGIPGHGLLPYGHVKAKVDPDYAETLKDKPNGKLILVAGITPTPAGGWSGDDVSRHLGRCKRTHRSAAHTVGGA